MLNLPIIFLAPRKLLRNKCGKCIDRGVLYTSGMIAGEGLVGILLAVFAVVGLNFDFSGIYGGSFETVGAIVGVIAFAALLGSMMYFCKGKKKQNA